MSKYHGFKDFVPGKHDQGGVSQANFRRHDEAPVYRHLKRAAEYLADLYRQRPFDRLILAGPAEVLGRTLEIERQIERTTEDRLLAELFGTAAAGGLARVGLNQTLEEPAVAWARS